MDINAFMKQENEKPLDNLVVNGGFCGIFRKIACIGDSLSSGEFESMKDGVKGYHDYFEYSWGQFIARDAGCTVYNFSRGGMTAKEYCESFAKSMDFWNVEKRCQAYILALGVNDVSSILNNELKLGTVSDIDTNDYKNNAKTFAGYYGQIIQRYQEMQPKGKFFLMSMPKGLEIEENPERAKLYDDHAKLLYEIAKLLPNCYVLDLRKYGPFYDKKFKDTFFLGGHLNATGYRLTATMVESYIDFIIRSNPKDFTQIGFVGKPFYNDADKW